MKKIMKVFLAISLLIMFASCERNSVSTDNISKSVDIQNKDSQLFIDISTKTDPIVNYDFHNNGLEYVYGKLLEVKQNYSQSKTADENWWGDNENLKEMTLSFIQDYFIQVFGEQIGAIEYNKALEPGLMASQMTVDEAIEHVMLSNLNEVTKSYIEQILSIDLKNFGTVESSLKIIRNNARRELTGEDLFIVLDMVEISLSSAKYWKDNLEKWAELFISGDEQPAYAAWWEDIVIWDVIGAAVGETYEDGDGTIGGTTSLVTSGIVAVVKLWKWLF